MADGIPDESVTLVLKKPLVIGDRTITELVIKEPTAGQMAAAEQTAKNGGTEQGIVEATMLRRKRCSEIFSRMARKLASPDSRAFLYISLGTERRLGINGNSIIMVG